MWIRSAARAGSPPGTRSRGGRGSAGIDAVDVVGVVGVDLLDGFRADLLQVFGQVAAEVLPGSARLARSVWSVWIRSAARAGSPSCTRSRGGRGSARIGAAGAVGADLIDGFRLDLLQAFGQVAVGGSPELARLVWSARICSAAAKIETNGDKKAGILSVGIRAISYYNCPVINVDSSVYY